MREAVKQVIYIHEEVDPDAIADISGHIAEMSVETLRIIKLSEPDPSTMIVILRKLIAKYSAQMGDSFWDQEMRRRRCVLYRWYCRAMWAWFAAAMRHKAQIAYRSGSWGYWFKRSRDWMLLTKCFAHLHLGGIAMWMGYQIDISATATALLNASVEFGPLK
jgi:hypothetical protein